VNGTLKLVDLTTAHTSPVKDSAGHAVTAAHPSASADGTIIAFVHYGKASGGVIPEQLQVYDADTLTVKMIAKGTQEAGIDGDPFGYPQISPDGSLIYVAHTGNDPGFSCTVYRTDGTKAFVSGYLAWPTPGAWSASKGSLAFGGAGTGGANGTISSGINVWLPGTPKAIPIVTYPNGKGVVGPMAWTPQAKQIVYTLIGTSGKADLWVIGADGTNKHLLLKNGSWPACAVAPVSFK
jgi:Tol biopolymer transport system component